MIPTWLRDLSFASLALGATCALLLAVDCVRRPQHMRIMVLVWPICALFGSLAVLWLYASHGRGAPRGKENGHDHAHHRAHGHGDGEHGGGGTPDPSFASIATDTLHCGSGCTLGDVCGEALLLLLVPALAGLLGYPALYRDRMFAGWILDTVFAYGFGILFQFFAIAPMRGLGVRDGLLAAIKADTLSLLCWQIGMFGFMAFAHVVLFGRWLGVALRPDMAVFWFAMQGAMICGFVTAFPMNRWLIRIGLKDGM